MNEKTKNILKMAGILVIGLLLGWILFGGNNTPNSEHNHSSEQAEETIWTCSMHPQIRMNEFGKCPLCGMDLIPLESNDSAADPNAIQMSENAMKLANIQTMTVGNKQASKELRLNGKVQIDERKLYAQSTHIPGRIEQLNINFTGEKVSRGQTLAMVYSPELVTAQEELLQANNIKNSQPELFEAAKQKLRNWKVADQTISKILSSGKPIQRFPITADVSGIVTAKKVELGDYVERGKPLYEIADLSSLWLLFDVYESDMTWVKKGDKISYSIQSVPGENFEGTISFIDPIINPQTRVATARIEVKNSDNKLKPEMFASGILKGNLNKTATQEIIIPKSAVMWTGERSIIYIKTTSSNNVNFILREVILGPSLGDAYIIKDGLENGEEIVVNGTFTIDAASQLAGKPSMMSPDIGKPVTSHERMNIDGEEKSNTLDASKMTKRITVSKEFQKQLKQVFDQYILLKDAFANDNNTTAQESANGLLNSLSNIDMKLITDTKAHNNWMSISKVIMTSANSISKTSEIEAQRNYFKPLSENLIRAVKLFGINHKAYEQFCPMADDNNGGHWLSLTEQINNPYFGSKMLKCGSVETIIE